MRLDVLSIFPEYLEPMGLSLIGRARERGILDLHTHNLRDWTMDRHHSVDDTPYGGGAGMVMKPEPWAQALDSLADTAELASNEPYATPRPILIVPGPSGARFTQRMASDLAQARHLVFACGRYEGIDERVYGYAAQRYDVQVVSLGDYVLNGGEVAVLAMIEAIARLIPGVIGNQESLVEESHEDGLLEYPVYTKPALWRDRAVPQVLLSGNHATIREWRHEQRLIRTAERRPDLLPLVRLAQPGRDVPADMVLKVAVPADAGELLTLSHACWVPEGRDHNSFNVPALTESLDEARMALADWTTWTLRAQGRLVASVRARLLDRQWEIARLMVAPDLQGQGLGSWLLEFAERRAPAEAVEITLTAGSKSQDNLRWYRRAGYRVSGTSEYCGIPTTHLVKTLAP